MLTFMPLMPSQTVFLSLKLLKAGGFGKFVSDEKQNPFDIYATDWSFS